jgi:hypothetical protein
MKTLLIDDMRDIEADIVCRNYFDGIQALIDNKGDIDLLYLDHDLASYDTEGNEVTGHDVMVWLELNPDYLPNRILCVSANPVGRNRIKQAIDRLYK